MKYVILMLVAAMTVGCASVDDGYYKAIEAQARAESSRYDAIAKIGSEPGATDVARVASVMALQDRGGGSSKTQIAPPRSFADTILQAAGILAPTLVQAYSVRQQTQLGMVQSNNGARVAESTNNAFVGIAGKIQAPAANVTTTTTTTTDASVRTRTDNSQRTADSGNTTTTSTWGANSGANSGNSGRLAGGDVVDSTHAPTVVNQPAPIVVTQPAPVIVQPPAPAQ